MGKRGVGSRGNSHALIGATFLRDKEEIGVLRQRNRKRWWVFVMSLQLSFTGLYSQKAWKSWEARGSGECSWEAPGQGAASFCRLRAAGLRRAEAKAPWRSLSIARSLALSSSNPSACSLPYRGLLSLSNRARFLTARRREEQIRSQPRSDPRLSGESLEARASSSSKRFRSRV